MQELSDKLPNKKSKKKEIKFNRVEPTKIIKKIFYIPKDSKFEKNNTIEKKNK